MAKRKADTERHVEKPVPALTLEGRENQLINASIDLVEERILNGTASSQEVCHFLKLGSTRNRLEMQKLKAETDLASAKIEAIQSAKQVAALYEDAIRAMKRYGGNASSEDDRGY